MIIKELELIHFGKFHHYKIELGPRLNLIFGGNEAGKSTVCAFIRCMFFGAQRLRGRAAAGDLYNRYMPWESGSNYEGAMIFCHEEKTYRLYRNFYKETQKVQLICLDTGKEVPLLHGHLGDLIPGLTEENYRNTIHVAQGQSTMDPRFALELQSQAANLALTGSANLHLGRALKVLGQERLKLQKSVPTDQLRSMEEKIQTLKQQRDPLGDGSGIGSFTDPLTPDQAKVLSGELAKVRRDMERRQTRWGMLLEAERQWKSQIRAQEELEAKDVRRSQKKLEAREGGSFFKIPYFWCLVLGSVFGVGTTFFWNQLEPVIRSLGAAASLLLVAAGIFGGGRFLGSVKREGPAPDAGSRVPADDSGSRGRLTAPEQLEGIAREKAQLAAQLKALNDREKDLENTIRQYQKQQERAAWEEERRVETENMLEDCQEALDQLKGKAGELKKEMFCVDTARNIIRSLAEEIHEDFGGQLCREASQIMEEITGHKRMFYVNPDLKVSVDNSKTLLPMERLSQGTVEQMQAALRLSAARIVFPQMEMPVIFDDTFAFYDDGRLRAFLSWLSRSRPGQAILMTCQHRECDFLDALNVDYNYVNLDFSDTFPVKRRSCHMGQEDR